MESSGRSFRLRELKKVRKEKRRQVKYTDGGETGDGVLVRTGGESGMGGGGRGKM